MTLSRNLWEHLEDPTKSSSQKERNDFEQPARTAVRRLANSRATVQHQTALTATPLMNARMSALITSAFVVIIPCEKPG
jgi:hypothetical protein